MAKFVLAGKADCPYFAKAEILADFLQINLPNFSIHKIRKHPKDWQGWLEHTCEQNGWKHQASPLVWRELVDRGGRGLLLGGFSDFLEHVQGYYDITSDMSSALMLEIAMENLQAAEQCMKEEEDQHRFVQPKHVWISSSLNLTCYHLIPLLCDGGVLGDSDVLWLHLLDVDGSAEALEGLGMEAVDLACPRIHQVSVHTRLDHAFLHAHVVVLLDELMSDQKEEEQTLVRMITELFQHYGQLLEVGANKDVRIIVAGNSLVNLKVSLLLENAPSLDSSQCVGIATQLENEARAQIAQKLRVKSADVRDMIVWGNIGGRFHIDLQRSKVFRCDSAIWGPPGFSLPISEMIYDRKWLQSDFLNFVGSHRTTMTGKTLRTAALSAANGIIAVLKAWDSDCTPGEVHSLCVLSKGQFGIPAGLVFSMPVRFQRGSWAVLPDITISEELRSNLQAAANQLLAEKKQASEH